MLLNEVNKRLSRSKCAHETIEGVYRVIQVKWHHDPQLGSCRRLELHDSSGSVHALLPGAECNPWLVTNAPYALRLEIHSNQEQPTIIVVSGYDTPVSNFNPLILLSAAWSPVPHVISKLLALYEELSSRSIARFWEAVFRNEPWVKGFLRLPASRACHHCAPGELFAHSVAVAGSVSATLENQPLLTDTERDAAITVALLHDATKVVWFPQNRNRWKVPFLFREHERLLPYFLAEPLLELGQYDQNTYGVLVRIIDDYIRPHECSNSPLSSIIREADRLDSHLDARDRERKINRSWRNWVEVGGRMYWSPTE